MLRLTAEMGSYFPNVASFKNISNSEEAKQVHAKVWATLSAQYINKESSEVLKSIFESNGQSIGLFKDKRVLDFGCGSGRFALGFEPLGAAEVIGMDLGKDGLDIGEKMAAKKGLTKTKFLYGDVLQAPFEDESFDFIFCKGVLHHTKDPEKGFAELYRLLRKGGCAFIYCYGGGGIFWHSRKRMREVLKLIPMEYTMRVLDLLGMPSKRYVFIDSWYVPIENHIKRSWFESHVSKQGYSKIIQVKNSGDQSVQGFPGDPEGQTLWGDGELRYFLTK
ncbi:class I SAM-dependent methyltransferase [Candidatus Peregrinibacteria bacterium]|nr:class I SAM-dependent methyltransferase [Candidatus Peregrinibacteria bacterium]